MLAAETTSGLLRLGITHRTTLPYSTYQNAIQESFWGRIEGRLMEMFEGDKRLTLDELNLASQAWTEQEYHRTQHSEINTTPLAHFMAGPSVVRKCTSSAELSASFRIEVKRKQRRSDGTVSLEGNRFEIPSRFRHLDFIHLHYARWDLSKVDLVDPNTGSILCPIKPLDKSAKASGVRKRVTPPCIDLSAKANGVEPYFWLCQVLEQLPAAKSLEDMVKLLPWNLHAATLGDKAPI